MGRASWAEYRRKSHRSASKKGVPDGSGALSLAHCTYDRNRDSGPRDEKHQRHYCGQGNYETNQRRLIANEELSRT